MAGSKLPKTRRGNNTTPCRWWLLHTTLFPCEGAKPYRLITLLGMTVHKALLVPGPHTEGRSRCGVASISPVYRAIGGQFKRTGQQLAARAHASPQSLSRVRCPGNTQLHGWAGRPAVESWPSTWKASTQEGGRYAVLTTCRKAGSSPHAMPTTYAFPA
jgi:hypothetical protein